MNAAEVAALRERLSRGFEDAGEFTVVVDKADLRTAVALIARLTAERDDLRRSVVAFGAPWAVEYAREHGLPQGYLHATHYDILARAGAHMDSFVCAPAPAAEES